MRFRFLFIENVIIKGILQKNLRNITKKKLISLDSYRSIFSALVNNKFYFHTLEKDLFFLLRKIKASMRNEIYSIVNLSSWMKQFNSLWTWEMWYLWPLREKYWPHRTHWKGLTFLCTEEMCRVKLVLSLNALLHWLHSWCLSSEWTDFQCDIISLKVAKFFLQWSHSNGVSLEWIRRRWSSRVPFSPKVLSHSWHW